MAQFQILTGKALNAAIAGRAKAVATFTEREHQIAYSALHHVELHNDPKYLNALYAVTPANYRKGLRSWSAAFGKVKFDDKAGEFVYVAGKKSNMEGALEVAPANYEKAAGKKSDGGDFDEVTYLERVLKKLEDNKANPRTIQAMRGVLTVAKSAFIETSREQAA